LLLLLMVRVNWRNVELLVTETGSVKCLQHMINSVRFEVLAPVTMKNDVLWDINPVRTLQETYYFPATEPNRLIVRKIRGSHGGDYEEGHLLGYKPSSYPTGNIISPLQSLAG
jgi:hypothetical protein